jgi:hypothetical protein
MKRYMALLALAMFGAWIAFAAEPGIDLAWQMPGVPGITATRIYYGTEPGQYTERIEIPATPGQDVLYTLTGIEPGAIIHIAVTAVDDRGHESAFSDAIAATMQIEDIPRITIVETRSAVWRRVHEIIDGVYKARWERVVE